MSVNIRINNVIKYCFIAVYIPPNSTDNNYIELFNFLQDEVNNSNCVYIFGDFNLSEVKGVDTVFHNMSQKLNYLYDFLNFNSFMLFNNIKNSLGRTLDLVICSEHNLNKCNVFRETLRM